MSTRSVLPPLDSLSIPSPLQAGNAALLEDLYEQFRRDPQSVPEDFRAYFTGLHDGLAQPRAPRAKAGAAPATGDATEALRLYQLVEAYRAYGHRRADINPLTPPVPRPELDPASYGFTDADLDRSFALGGLFGMERGTLRELVTALRETYCGSIGVEAAHIDDAETRRWLQERLESTRNRLDLPADLRRKLLERLTDAEVFEQFLHTKYLAKKRFSLEGGESLVPLIDLVIDESAARGVTDVVIGMAHRGRLNVLVNVMGKPASEILRGFDDSEADAREMLGSGDVKYHLGFRADQSRTLSGHPVHLVLAFNPSHLEAIYPVVNGRVRALQDRMGDTSRTRALSLVIHGDAAFAGQGVVAESLNFSQLPGYTTGGTVHVIVNNQVGFTTGPEEARSSTYATGLARSLDIPILHVNGEDLEAVAQAVRVAVEFRHRFQRDVVIDLYCYRKYGHNEGDEPNFTQPLMYQQLAQRPSVREKYAQRLLAEGIVTEGDVKRFQDARRDHLEAELVESRSGKPRRRHNLLGDQWSAYRGGRFADTPDVPTGLERPVLEKLAHRLVQIPEGFEPHPKLVRGPLKDRQMMAAGEKPFDWGTAELLAFASLLDAGHRVRLSGQDAARGTFSHRHAVVYDHRTQQPYNALATVGPFEVRNSPLSEYAVMGFDYGYSLDFPEALVLWEGQFGDFVNGAQIIIDQFLSSAEDKWERLTSLVLLLPHGYEGQGPEHSSARPERFLNSSADDNWQVVNLTTPAQYFHALRRQVLRPLRKPLVIMTPKSLLRSKDAVSSYEDLAGEFQRVIGDRTVDPERVRRVLLCTGKVYYDLAQRRADAGIDDTAIVRIEELYPYPQAEVTAELDRYPNLKKLTWVQEEPWNMGAWLYLRGREHAGRLANKIPLQCVARPESSSPATGSQRAHELEQSQLLDEAFAEDKPARRAASSARR